MKKTIGFMLVILLGSMLIMGRNLPESDTDLSWVAGLVGFESGVQTTTEDGIKIVYTISDSKEALNLIREGLKKRGWRIKQPKSVNVLTESVGVFVGKLYAYKGSATLNVSVHGVGGSQSLVMILYGGTTPSPTSCKSAKVSVSTSGDKSSHVEVTTTKPDCKSSHISVKTTTATGKKIVIDEDETNKTIFCKGYIIQVLSNECNLKLTGHCKKIHVVGNDNVITIQGEIDIIKTPGNRNTVTWQASQEPQPKISNLGTDNTLKTVK